MRKVPAKVALDFGPQRHHDRRVELIPCDELPQDIVQPGSAIGRLESDDRIEGHASFAVNHVQARRAMPTPEGLDQNGVAQAVHERGDQAAIRSLRHRPDLGHWVQSSASH